MSPALLGSARPLVLRGATVIDGWSGNPRSNVTILVRNGHIAAMGTGDEVGVPDGAQVLDCTGRWIIPGLIDMHCHIKDHYAPHFLAGGVTTVRNTAGNVHELADLRSAAIDAPTPRVISADRLIDGPPGTWPGGTNPWHVLIDNVEDALAEVHRQIEAGTDLVKIYSLLKPEVARAIAEEAHAFGVATSCDIEHSSQYSIRDVARWGYRWNEHATGFIQALYPGYNPKDAATHAAVPWEEPDSPELDALCREVADRGLMLCPTMVLIDQAARSAAPWRPDHFVIDATDVLFSHWKEIAGHPGLARLRRFHKFNQAIARAFRRAGGVVVAGTDVPAAVWTYPGLALHRELEIMVENGWSPMEALQAATSVPAAAMGRRDIGALRPSAVADMLVLTADPLADISNTRSIERIVKGGRLYTPEETLEGAPPVEATVAKAEKLMAEFGGKMQ